MTVARTASSRCGYAQSDLAKSLRRDGDPLDSNEFQIRGFRTLNFDAKLDGLADAIHQQVERLGLSVASGQLRHGSHVDTSFVALEDHVELAAHDAPARISNSISRIRNFCTLPVTVMGKFSTKRTSAGTLK